MAFIPPLYFDTLVWGAREGDDPGDPNAALLVIRPGELDAVATANARVWKIFKQTITWPKLATLFGELWAVQVLALGSVDRARYVSTAEGVQLNLLGELINRPRDGLDDQLYRLAIRAEAQSLIGSGTIPEIVEISRALLGDDMRVRELFPRLIIILAPDIPTDVWVVMLEILRSVPVVGVQAMMSTWEEGQTYGWGSSTDPGATEVEIAGAWSSSTGADADSGPALWSDGQPVL